MKISVNDVFEPVTELSLLSTMARAIHLDEKHDALIVMDLTDPPRKPYSIGLEEFRSEEHTSELQSLMRISYAVFCLKKKTNYDTNNTNTHASLYPSRV